MGGQVLAPPVLGGEPNIILKITLNFLSAPNTGGASTCPPSVRGETKYYGSKQIISILRCVFGDFMVALLQKSKVSIENGTGQTMRRIVILHGIFINKFESHKITIVSILVAYTQNIATHFTKLFNYSFHPYKY